VRNGAFNIIDVNPRTFNQKVPAVWSDKQVAVADCQGRMSDYRYAMYADADEFIIPNVENLRDSWIKYAVSEHLYTDRYLCNNKNVRTMDLAFVSRRYVNETQS